MMSKTALGCEIITTWEAPTTTPDSSERLNHRTLGRCHEPVLCCGKIGGERRQNIARGTRGAKANASSRGFTFDLHIARIPESAGVEAAAAKRSMLVVNANVHFAVFSQRNP
jgi:hypothetical protein